MFDNLDGVDDEYAATAAAMSKAIKESVVVNVFFETYNELNSLPYQSCKKGDSVFRLGTNENVKRYTKEEAEIFGVVKANEVRIFTHFHLDVPSQFVDTSGKSVESIMADYRSAKEVFKRAMDDISLDTFQLVKDLIVQGSLFEGETHVHKIDKMLPFKNEYNTLASNQKDNWSWVTSSKLPFAKFRNELIGVLCSDLSDGMEINKACQAWNKRVDPANYMKAVAPFTQRQKDAAAECVKVNGYTESFNRRLATMSDIKVSEIKHANAGDGKIEELSLFDGLKPSKSTRHKKNEFDGVEEVSIEKFMKDILPGCTSVEAYLDNNHVNHMVTMTTASTDDSKPMFKWDNNYSWTFNGNLAGKSQIKEAVKSRGGAVEGIVNIRMAFPTTESDYDLHVKEPNGNNIGYECVRRVQPSSGVLDLDAQGVDGHQSPDNRVENINYTDINKMSDGDYLVYVHDYNSNRFPGDCLLEIEIDGDVTSLVIESHSTNVNTVNVCIITKSGSNFTVTPSKGVKESGSSTRSREIYGLDTKQFHKVNLMCLSPNHWGENKVGSKHYLFMLDKCKAESDLRGYHIENFNAELAGHRKVLEPLASTIMISPEGDQLSGLGFNATVRDELIVKLSGSHKRTVKIKF